MIDTQAMSNHNTHLLPSIPPTLARAHTCSPCAHAMSVSSAHHTTSSSFLTLLLSRPCAPSDPSHDTAHPRMLILLTPAVSSSFLTHLLSRLCAPAVPQSVTRAPTPSTCVPQSTTHALAKSTDFNPEHNTRSSHEPWRLGVPDLAPAQSATHQRYQVNDQYTVLDSVLYLKRCADHG